MHRTTLQVFRYFARVLLDKISLEYLRFFIFIFKIMEKVISRNTSQQLLQRLQKLVFSSTFNNVSQAFHLSTFNNVSQVFHLSNFINVSQKIFFRPLINSGQFACFNLITLQNFVLRI